MKDLKIYQHIIYSFCFSRWSRYLQLKLVLAFTHLRTDGWTYLLIIVHFRPSKLSLIGAS